MKSKRKGISLIVLVITIIVIIILAGGVILTLSENNPINAANEAVFKSDLDAVESDLSLYLTSQYASTISFNPDNLNADELTAEYNDVEMPGKTIKDIIPVLSSTTKYDGQFEVVNGKLVYIGTDRTKKKWAQEVNIDVIDADRLDGIITTLVTLPVSAGTNVVATIKISSNASINNINLTGNLELLDINNVVVPVQPVFEIGTPTGDETDTLRNVEVTIKTNTLAEGTYKLKLKEGAISNIYDVTNETDIVTGELFEIDNTPPTNPGMLASPTGWTNLDVIVTITYPEDSVVKEYSTDGENWSTYTSPVTVTTNNTTVYARGKDVAGNQSGQSTMTIANIDREIPTVAYGTNGGENLQVASTKVTVNDVGVSGVDTNSLKYIWDTQNVTEPTGEWTTFENDETINKANANGTYYLWIKASDNTGNSIVTKSNAFVVDNIIPENPIMSANPSTWTNGDVTVTIIYPLDAAIKEYSTDTLTWNVYTVPVVITTNNTTVYSRAKDSSGNQSEQSSMTVANIDKITPTATYGTNGGTNLQTASTTVTASDLGGSNIASLQYFWDIQNIAEPTSGWTSFTNETTITKTGFTGTYYLWVKVIDNAGNSTVIKSNAFVADNTPPVNPTMSASPTGWTNGNVTVTITYPSDAAVKQYSTDAAIWNTYTSGVVVTTNNTTVYAKATDASGNQSGQSTLTVTKIDKVAPTIVATYKKADGTAYTSDSWTNQSVVITGAGNDGTGSGVANYQITYDGSNFYDLPNGTVTLTTSGRTGVWVRARDNVGNVGPNSATYLVAIDKFAPNVSFGTNGATNVQVASTTVSVTDDSLSGLNSSSLQYVWDTQNVTTPTVGWASFTNASVLSKSNVNGTYYLWIKASDNAGNVVVSKSNAFSIVTYYAFNYTGNYQTWTVPSTGTYKLEVWGAQGGYNGGYGGYATGNITLSIGQIIYVYVGGQGFGHPLNGGSNLPGGFNGGGGVVRTSNSDGGTGGGATDVRIGGQTLNDRKIVAGGGGGGGAWASLGNHTGGAGGGITGADGNGIWGTSNGYTYNGNGYGGTQTAGGLGSTQTLAGGTSLATNGTFGVGGSGGNTTSGGSAGGGGGWYGGGGGCVDSGGAGSGYIGGVTSSSMQSGIQTGNGKAAITFISQ